MKTVTVSVPGKIMLAGEYAALKGGTAMACSVDSYLHVTATPSRQKDEMTGCSEYLGNDVLVSNRDFAPDQWRSERAPLAHLLAVLKKEYPARSLHFEIKSKLDVSFGAGSSSALRLACALAAAQFESKDGEELAMTARWDAARLAWNMQSEAQNQKASGYDIATQLIGGIVSMRYPGAAHLWPGTIVQHRQSLEALKGFVTILVNDHGSKTAPLVHNTSNWLEQHKLWDQLINLSDEFSAVWVRLLSSEDAVAVLPEFFECCAQHRKFLFDSPAANSQVFTKLRNIPGLDSAWTYKLTGAGGDDALMVVGEQPHRQAAIDALRVEGWKVSPFNFGSRGAVIEVSQ